MKIRVLTVVAAAVLLLFGCDRASGQGDLTDTEAPMTPVSDTGSLDTEAQTADTSAAVTEPSDIFSSSARETLTALQTSLADDRGLAAGSAYLGTCDGAYDAVLAHVQHMDSASDSAYPWLSEMPSAQFFSNEGMQLYAVVPADGWTMTVSEYGMDPNNDYIPAVGETVYEGTEPVLLQGNISDAVPGFQILLKKDGATVEYYPSLSLENGLLLPCEGVDDLTPYYAVFESTDNSFISYEKRDLAGHWTSSVSDRNGNEVLMYLSLTEDGGAAFSFGYGNSEMGESYGGSWSGMGDAIALQLTGGIFDMAEGCVPAPYRMESVYTLVWNDVGKNFTLHLQSGQAPVSVADCTALTFTCTEMISPQFDPYRDILKTVPDPKQVAGDWYGMHAHTDGNTYSMHLQLLEDGGAVYRYGYAFGEILEQFNGTWRADESGILTLDMRGGYLLADESEYYDFDGKFEWDMYEGNLSLYHTEGSLLLADTENWVLPFMPFDFTLYEGEWVSAYDDGSAYRLYLSGNGSVFYSVENGDAVNAGYHGFWSVDGDMHLQLSMKLIEGTGELHIRSEYVLDWAEFPLAMIIRTSDDGTALSQAMSENGEDTFRLILPDAVG